MNVKQSVEAVLFSSGKYVSIDEIAKLCRSDVKSVAEVLEELKRDYESKDSSIMIANEGDRWKLTVREKFVPLVRKRTLCPVPLNRGMMNSLKDSAKPSPMRLSPSSPEFSMVGSKLRPRKDSTCILIFSLGLK